MAFQVTCAPEFFKHCHCLPLSDSSIISSIYGICTSICLQVFWFCWLLACLLLTSISFQRHHWLLWLYVLLSSWLSMRWWNPCGNQAVSSSNLSDQELRVWIYRSFHSQFHVWRTWVTCLSALTIYCLSTTLMLSVSGGWYISLCVLCA